jgi:predicted ribosome-associated RNA-binding protein Tma20
MQSNFQKNNIEQLEKSENSNSNSESIQNGIEECSVVEEEEEEEEFKPYLYDDEVIFAEHCQYFICLFLID